MVLLVIVYNLRTGICNTPESRATTIFSRYILVGVCTQNNPSPTWSCDLHVRWRECPWPPLVYDPVGLGQKVFHEKLEGSRDDDGDSGRDLTHLLVTLHYLLYPGLKTYQKIGFFYSKLSSYVVSVKKLTGGNLALYFFFLPGMVHPFSCGSAYVDCWLCCKLVLRRTWKNQGHKY